MSTDDTETLPEPRPSAVPAALPEPEQPGRIRQLGALSGFLVILLLDLLALDDITTAGAWIPEIVFLFASIPALTFLGYYGLRKPGGRGALEAGEKSGGPALEPGERNRQGEIGADELKGP